MTFGVLPKVISFVILLVTKGIGDRYRGKDILLDGKECIGKRYDL